MSEVAVLVPTLNRPRNVLPLVESFLDSDTHGRLVFLIDTRDVLTHKAATIAADMLDSVVVLDAPELPWPKRINYGYRNTTEPWLLCAADDVKLHKGWFQATKRLRDNGFGVIGTNDLGNPRVLRGEHATHPLVARSYADQCGTIDESGAILCEDYHHNFSDDELVATAKSRGAWAFCAESVVEHNHYYWGKGKPDATYARNESFTAEDRALWQQRSQRFR